MKPLLPTLREKKRYLAFEIITGTKISFDEISKSINKTVLEFLGTLGASKAGIIIMKDKYRKQKGLIRVSHRHVNQLKSALMFITKINNKNVIVKSVGVSGILKKAEAKYLR